MNVALTHIALHVSDLDACIAFYDNYCGMGICQRRTDEHSRVVWLAEPGKERDFIIVVIDGGTGRNQAENDFSHLGFAVESKQRVDELAARGLGKNTRLAKVQAFAISSALVAVAGSLYAAHVRYLDPSSASRSCFTFCATCSGAASYPASFRV